MLVQFATMALGLAVLLVAGDLLVRGAVSLALSLRIPALIVSLTIVAFGTSAPELFVSVQAVLEGQSGIAIGNIVGSNIANVLLVLGLPAIIFPITTKTAGLRRHGVVMLAGTIAFAAIAYTSGAIDRAAGAVLFGGVIAYVAWLWIRSTRRGADEPTLADASEFADAPRLGARTVLFLIAGLAGLPFGAHLLVETGAALAASFGVREEVIGLTIIAFGTSLPELATVCAAAWQKKSDVAVGSVVGSNIFNLLAVAGAAGLTGTAYFNPASLTLEMPVMLAATAVLCGYMFLRRDIGRISGLALTLGYAGFLAALVATAVT